MRCAGCASPRLRKGCSGCLMKSMRRSHSAPRRLERCGRPLTGKGRLLYEDVTAPDALPFPGQGRSHRKGRSAEFIRSRRMTLREQARLLVQSLGRVLADLDTVAARSLEALGPATLSDHVELDSEVSYQIPRIGTISFVPDEGSTALRSALTSSAVPNAAHR